LYRDEEKFKEIAKERIEILFELVRRCSDEELARNYVKLAKRISEFCNVRLKDKKALFCKKCFTFFNSKNSKVRLNPKKKRVEILCLNCGYKRFYGYVKEVKLKRKNKNNC